MLRTLCLLLCLVLLSACAGQPARELACDLACPLGFQETLLSSPPFTLFALVKKGQGPRLIVYLEGDGHAYHSAYQASDDPTPRYPCALHLALHDPSKSHICYLARPGQYLDLRQYPCAQRFWTDERQSPKVVSALSQAIDQVKALCSAQKLVLVGYSGGGGLAALLAQTRQDVEFLATAAGNLALDCWVREKQIAQLTGSLDPITRADALQKLPQRHILGTNDQIIPRTCSEAFCRKAGAKLTLLQDFGHREAWHTLWNYNYE
ncbi:MAG: hypothetical protein J5846_07285 [Desulfovibrio sp.]|nr:hypothetical protein [Desulfovibrio sp.]